MKRVVSLIIASLPLLLLLSCQELDDMFYGGYARGKGEAELQSVSLGYMGDDVDLDKYKSKMPGSKKKVLDVDRVPTTKLGDRETASGMNSALPDLDVADYTNRLDINQENLTCLLKFYPFDARVDSVRITSSDISKVEIHPGWDDEFEYILKLNDIGTCELTMTVYGKNTITRHIPIEIDQNIKMQVCIDPYWLFWGDRHARLKYKVKDMPKNQKVMYLNTTDSLTFFSQGIVIDQRRGEKAFRTINDTLRYKAVNKTRKFSKGKKVFLRNITNDIVATERPGKLSYFKVTPAIRTMYEFGDARAPYSFVTRNGKFYLRLFEGTDAEQDIEVDRTQAKIFQFHTGKWYEVMQHSDKFQEPKQWPQSAKFVQEPDGQLYMATHIMCEPRQVMLNMTIVPANPYCFFEISRKETFAEQFVSLAETVTERAQQKVEEFRSKVEDFSSDIKHAIELLTQHLSGKDGEQSGEGEGEGDGEGDGVQEEPLEEADEDDDSDDWYDHGDDVVGTDGETLDDYFVYSFYTQLTSAKRDSLSKDLNEKIVNLPDSSQWVLDLNN